MAEFDGEVLGALLTLLGYDGLDFQNIAVDENGYLKVLPQTAVLPDGIATEGKQDTIITLLGVIDNLVAALHSVGDDELDVVVEASALPSGGATSANQATANTSLGDIKTAAEAIQSLLGGTLSVKGEDQLFSYNSQYLEENSETSSSATLHINDLSAVPEGEIWVVNAVSVSHNQTANKPCYMAIYDGSDYYVLGGNSALAPNAYASVNGSFILKEGDKIAGLFYLVGLSYTTRVYAVGYKMSLD